ncbi:AMP-binding protein [Maricurvus nonylphenolicus]|uniref:class I adenylate-forming enzyme family protein n=1 Tax=Maricurvus nonylphenolicus TaxID=1008307 RepID=UPI0036F1BEC2
MNIRQLSMEKPLIELIDEACERYADDICLQYKDEKYTYAEVRQESIKVAQGLAGEGFRKGMHGAIYSLNSARAFIVTLGIIRAGGVWLPINPRNSDEDNIRIIKRFGCQALFYQYAFSGVARSMCNSLEDIKVSVCLDQEAGCPGYETWLKDSIKEEPTFERTPQDIVSIPMTGGTTGEPKGVVLSDRNFRYMMKGSFDTLVVRGEQPVQLCAAPMTHGGGRAVLCFMSVGARFVVLDRVDPQEVLQTIHRERVSDLFLPPTAIYALLAQPNVRDFDYSCLREVTYASAPMSQTQLRLAVEVFGPVMQGVFGQTECPMHITRFPPEEHFINGELAPESRLKSVGRVTTVSEVAILDDDCEELPIGELGEIGVKGGIVAEGYYQDPEETAKIRKNGWHLTGDIGYLDADGYLFIVDRKKDMIISGGFNVYSSEVEQAIATLEGVTCAAVIGVPHEHWGEEVTALVQRSEGSVITSEEIIVACKKKIGGVKAPKRVEFVVDFPKTPIGKIDKKALKSRYSVEVIS